jgi:hypothetical protein
MTHIFRPVVIYTTWPKVCEHWLIEHLIPKSWALIWSWSPLCARLDRHGNLFCEAPGEQSGTRYWLFIRGHTIFTHLSTWRSRSLSLCGLPLRDWAVVKPRRFHFTITALTVDRSSSSRAEIWRTDLLERLHPMTVPRSKSLSSSLRPFYCQCLSMAITWLCARFYTTGVAEIAEGMSTYVCIYSVYSIILWLLWHLQKSVKTHKTYHTVTTVIWIIGPRRSVSRVPHCHALTLVIFVFFIILVSVTRVVCVFCLV